MKSIAPTITYITLNNSRLVDQLDIDFPSKIKDSVIVVDEAHNLFNMIISGSAGANKLFKLINDSSNTNVVFISGTPMVNDPFDIVPCINLIHGKEIFVFDGIVFDNLYIDDTVPSNPTTKHLWDL
jgi:hypothetical protein